MAHLYLISITSISKKRVKTRWRLVEITSKSKERHKQDGVISKSIRNRKREKKERWLVFEIERESKKQDGVFRN